MNIYFVETLTDMLAQAEAGIYEPYRVGICCIFFRKTNGKTLNEAFVAMGYHNDMPIEVNFLKLEDELDAAEFYYTSAKWEHDSPQYEARIELLKQLIKYYS